MMSARELLSIAFRHRWSLVLAMLLPPVVAVAAALLMTPVYQATATVLIKAGREYLGRADAAAAQNGMAPATTKQEVINSEIEILGSASLAEQVIAKIGTAAIYPDLAAARPEMAVAAFQRNLDAKPVKLSNVIAVSFRHPDPKVAVDVTAKALDVFRAMHADIYSERRSPFLEQQLEEITRELSRLEQQRADMRVDTKVYSAEQQRIRLITLQGDAQRELSEAQSRQAELQERLRALRGAQAGTRRTETSSETSASLIALRAQEEQLLARLQPDNPLVRNVQRQIAAIERRPGGGADLANVRTQPNPVSTRIAEDLVAAQADLRPLAPRITALKAAVDRYGQQLRTVEGADRGLRALDRQIEALQGNARTYRERLDEARMQEDLDRSKVVSLSVIEPARASINPVAPRKTLYGLGGLAAGLVLAGAVLLVALIGQNTFLTSEQVERVMGVPVLVTVPLLLAGPAPVPARSG